MAVAALGPSTPLLSFGPPGWIAFGVVAVGTIGLTYFAAKSVTSSQTSTVTDTTTKSCERPWTAHVHAQGNDCGSGSGATIGAPTLIKPAAPVTTGEGLMLSNATFAMLNSRQQGIRVRAKSQLERYVQNRPPLGQKSFPATDRSGGKRYDIDNYGCSPNFLV